MEHIAVNPTQGQVAIPYTHGDATHVVGCLGSRAIRWAEQALGRGIDDVYMEFLVASVAATEGGSLGTISVSCSSTLIWAGIEHHRRKIGGPLPEYSIDDADEIVEQIGVDQASLIAVTLLQLSLPFKPRLDRIETEMQKEGKSAVDPLMAVARGTGSSSSSPPSPPACPSPTSGN